MCCILKGAQSVDKEGEEGNPGRKKQLVQKGTTVYYHEKTDAFRS